MINFFKKLFGGGADLSEIIGQGAMIVDVRSPEEFRRGHAEGAVNIPLYEIRSSTQEHKKQQVKGA